MACTSSAQSPSRPIPRKPVQECVIRSVVGTWGAPVRFPSLSSLFERRHHSTPSTIAYLRNQVRQAGGGWPNERSHLQALQTASCLVSQGSLSQHHILSRETVGGMCPALSNAKTIGDSTSPTVSVSKARASAPASKKSCGRATRLPRPADRAALANRVGCRRSGPAAGESCQQA